MNKTQIKKPSIIVAILVAGALSGCSTTSGVMQYQSSTQNVIAIQDNVGKDNVKVKVGEFTASSGAQGTQWCRANGPISIGNGVSPAEFIRQALQQELFTAGIYSSKSPVTITGNLDSLSFSSVSPADWEITLTLSSNNGASYQVTDKHHFDTSWDAISACKNVADAFVPAVQEAINKAVKDPRFKSLLSNEQKVSLGN